ncbi:hypothetical protein Tco_1401674 [Tanacetum coccineum]
MQVCNIQAKKQSTNGSKEKRLVPIEDSNSKALVEKDSKGEIDWTKEFDDDPVTFAMVALNGMEEDDWSIEIDADHVDLGQDRLGVFDWSEEDDNSPVALALMATSSTDSSNTRERRREESKKREAMMEKRCEDGKVNYVNDRKEICRPELQRALLALHPPKRDVGDSATIQTWSSNRVGGVFWGGQYSSQIPEVSELQTNLNAIGGRLVVVSGSIDRALVKIDSLRVGSRRSIMSRSGEVTWLWLQKAAGRCGSLFYGVQKLVHVKDFKNIYKLVRASSQRFTF